MWKSIAEGPADRGRKEEEQGQGHLYSWRETSKYGQGVISREAEKQEVKRKGGCAEWMNLQRRVFASAKGL